MRHRIYWWGGAAVAAAGLIIACSSDVDPGYKLVKTASRDLVQPLPFLRAVGCRATTRDSVGPGSFLVPTKNGPLFFNCAGIDRTVVRRALRSYRDSLGVSLGAAMEAGDYVFEFWNTTQCYAGGELLVGYVTADANGDITFSDQNGNPVHADGFYPGAEYYVWYQYNGSCTTSTTWFQGDWDGPPPETPPAGAPDIGPGVSGPVTPPPPPPPPPAGFDSLSLGPSTFSANVGDETRPLTVTAWRGGTDTVLSYMDVQWSASPGEMLRPDDLGSFDVLEGGTGTITAKYVTATSTATGSATVTVDGFCPANDPRCKLPLSKLHRIQLSVAIDSTRLRQNFTNDSIRTLCQNLFHDLEVEWTQRPDSFFEGNDSIPDAQHDSHDAEYQGTGDGAGSGNFHLDQNYLDGGHDPNETLALMMHEIVHAYARHYNNASHPRGYVVLDGVKLYSDPIFNVTSTGATQNPNSCLP